MLAFEHQLVKRYRNRLSRVYKLNNPRFLAHCKSGISSTVRNWIPKNAKSLDEVKRSFQSSGCPFNDKFMYIGHMANQDHLFVLDKMGARVDFLFISKL